MQIDFDAFSSGQVDSKLWLCRELEALLSNQVDLRVWILGSWYSLLAHQLLTRERLSIKSIRSFDKDPSSVEFSNRFLENWVWKDWQFRAIQMDVNTLEYSKSNYGDPPHLVINTSVEHMIDKQWWENIPTNTFVAIQSCDMNHSDHVFKATNLEQLKKEFRFSELLYSGSKNFSYPNWQFNRWMLIGKK